MYNLGIIIVLIISNQPCATCWADLKSLADYSLSCIPLSPITICGEIYDKVLTSYWLVQSSVKSV